MDRIRVFEVGNRRMWGPSVAAGPRRTVQAGHSYLLVVRASAMLVLGSQSLPMSASSRLVPLAQGLQGRRPGPVLRRKTRMVLHSSEPVRSSSVVRN